MKSTKGVTSDRFLIKDLTGTTGRLDIIFRCILAAFIFGKRNIFFHTTLHGPPNPPITFEFNGNKLENLPLDEIRMARLFQTLLHPTNPPFYKGIIRSRKPFFEIATELSQLGPLFLLKESAPSFQDILTSLPPASIFTFILSDFVDLQPSEERLLIKELHARPISLSLTSYLASHCIIFVLMHLRKCIHLSP
ncbi:MAG: hypothetical protein ACTSRS_03595 [Candidatus Helarchaeota archaeon]